MGAQRGECWEERVSGGITILDPERAGICHGFAWRTHLLRPFPPPLLSCSEAALDNVVRRRNDNV